MVGAKVGYGTREIGELLGICASVVEAMALKFSTIRKLSAVHESLSLCFIRDGRRAFWGDVWRTLFDSNGRMRLACLPACKVYTVRRRHKLSKLAELISQEVGHSLMVRWMWIYEWFQSDRPARLNCARFRTLVRTLRQRPWPRCDCSYPQRHQHEGLDGAFC